MVLLLSLIQPAVQYHKASSSAQGLFTTLSGAAISTFIGLWFRCVVLTLTSHSARLKAWRLSIPSCCDCCPKGQGS